MPTGKLEVLLVGCKGLEDADFLSNISPYVVLTCRTQEQKSSVASGQGSEPEWNETFVFSITGDVSDLALRLMDKDTLTADDFVGEATALFLEGSLPPTSYNVVKDQEYCGEIRVGLTFTPESDRGFRAEEENFGGWKESSYTD
ncbi:hypothetical protein JRO89_XS01G0310100 [Xanthoceras sorbifolium]|uniref:C2 domain-containing protein n=1 Tax=Xanthoceras sorbifolium TaxID=99658 RepID=A0ABQ8IMH6_9ROSI|nr:hypothetical protein JRO89_XS01G0310100 [Xanthoceras sorbifolium]